MILEFYYVFNVLFIDIILARINKTSLHVCDYNYVQHKSFLFLENFYYINVTLM